MFVLQGFPSQVMSVSADDDPSSLSFEQMDPETFQQLKGLYDNLSRIMKLHETTGE